MNTKRPFQLFSVASADKRYILYLVTGTLLDLEKVIGNEESGLSRRVQHLEAVQNVRSFLQGLVIVT
jgi:hypothetical protein